jgi:hypothetical protein
MEMIEKFISLEDLATLLSIDTSDIGLTDLDDVGLEIETPTGFKQVSSFVVKEPAEGWQLNNLLATSVHRVLDKGEWKFVKDIAEARPTGKQINVVDLEIPDGECYIANGYVNHNTTPGGWN